MAVTNAIDSPLADAAEIAIDVRAGAERAVAATKSYTAELLSLYLLIAGVGAAEAAARLPEAAARTLALTPDDRLAATGGAAPVRRAAGADGARLLVRDRARGGAQADGVQLRERDGVLRRGSAARTLAMIDHSVPVIAVTSPGRGGEAMGPVLERLAGLGAHVLRVGDAEGLPIAADGLAEELLPVLEILPLQRLAWRVALDRGIDPDRPRGLSKVTQTL